MASSSSSTVSRWQSPPHSLCVGELKNSTIASIGLFVIGLLSMIAGALFTSFDLSVRNGLIMAGFGSFCIGVLGCIYIAGKTCCKNN